MSVISIAAQPGTRAVEHVRGGFVFECICGALVPVELDVRDGRGHSEFAITCDCGQTHWFLVTRRAA